MQKTSNILLSVQPQWIEKILSGEKTLELRKARPSINPPFTIYLYQTLHGGAKKNASDGMVVGKCTCSYIRGDVNPANGLVDVIDIKLSCLTPQEVMRYANGKIVYWWRLVDVERFTNPRPLSDFTTLQRAPQSYCFIGGEKDAAKS